MGDENQTPFEDDDLDSLEDFFQKATTGSVRIDPYDLNFPELTRLAHSANRMVDMRYTAESALRRSEENFSLS